MSKRETIGLDFKEDVRINRFSLETECEIQPEMYWFYSEQLVQKKTEFKRARAKKELDIRENPGKYGEKITEGFVKAIIEGDETLAAMEREYLLLEAACEALSDRRSQLRNLTELVQTGYYANMGTGSPTSSGDHAETEMRDHLTKKNKEK